MPQPMCYFFLKILLHNLPHRTQMHQHVRSNLCTHIFNRLSSTKFCMPKKRWIWIMIAKSTKIVGGAAKVW